MSAKETAAMLEVKSIHCSYGNIEVIKGLQFDIPEGKIVALIGANGAGKTTTLKAISGLMKVSGGSIVYKGKDITNRAPHDIVARGIAHIPEGRQVFPELSVHDNLLLGGYTVRDKRLVHDRIEEIYAHFPRLRERCGQLAGTLSGGEQQMMAIGRALVSAPELLLLDEPSMGLSPKLVSEVFDIIEGIRERGTTILLVEQNAHLALEVADYAHVLQTGEIVLSGTGEDISSNDDVRRAYLAE
ncbi:MAG TPA: ABC transporter ATP-binding protein [Candidatus Methanomethylicus sp.]|nr:ABC transporter ATP-binding protein [Candidatus Methanomethylicus sp.]